MKTTRIMAVAVLTMGSALALYTAQQAKAQAPGITRTDLQRHDLSVHLRVMNCHVHTIVGARAEIQGGTGCSSYFSSP